MNFVKILNQLYDFKKLWFIYEIEKSMRFSNLVIKNC